MQKKTGSPLESNTRYSFVSYPGPSGTFQPHIKVTVPGLEKEKKQDARNDWATIEIMMNS